jgi:hypothetical protein
MRFVKMKSEAQLDLQYLGRIPDWWRLPESQGEMA